MEPDARLGAALGERAHRVDRGRRRRADRRDDRGRLVERRSRGASGTRRRPEPCRSSSPRIRAAFSIEKWACSERVHDAAGAQRPRGGERGERRGRCGVLDVAVQAGRQPEQLGEPVQHDLLELGRRRRGDPRHRVHVQRGDEELGEDPGLRARVREIGEEARVVPVREPGHDHLSRSASTSANGSARSGGDGRQAARGSRPARRRRRRAVRRRLEVGRDPVGGGGEIVPEGHRGARKGKRCRCTVTSRDVSRKPLIGAACAAARSASTCAC